MGKRQSASTENKPRFKIYKGRYDKTKPARWVAYDLKSKKRITRSVKQFKTRKEFKRYITDTHGQIPAQDYKKFDGQKVTMFKGSYQAESQKPVSSEFYVLGKYVDDDGSEVYGNSGYLSRPNNAELEEAKDDVKQQILLNIIRKRAKLQSYDVDIDEYLGRKEYVIILQKINDYTTFRYMNVYRR